MADPYKYVTDRGVIIPDTSELLEQVQGEYRAVFGEDLSVDPGTPQGVLISMETSTRAAIAEGNALLANQIHPDYAQGQFLDALCAFLGIYRRPATRTLKRGLVLAGIGGTVVPAGSRVRTAAGDTFVSTAQVIIQSSGLSAPVNFQAVETGPVPAPIGSLVNIGDSILGWTNVIDTAVPVLGTDQESDAQLAERRRVMLAKQGRSSVEAQISDLYGVEGVRSLQYRENIAATTEVIDGITMVAHSVWACVDGGTDMDVATSLLENKTDGAAWNGDTVVDVLEPASGQTYQVKFDRPELIPIEARATIKVMPGASGDPVEMVPQILEDYGNGLILPLRGFTVGTEASPFQMSAAISRTEPAFIVMNMEIRYLGGTTWVPATLPIDLDQMATLGAGSVQVVVVN